MKSCASWLLVLAALMLAGCQEGGVREAPQQGEVVATPQQQDSKAAIYAELAAEYMREGNYRLALENANKTLQVDPGYIQGYLVAALIQQRLGQAGQAERYFQLGLAKAPQDPYLLNAYGTFLCAQDRYQEAEQQLLKAANNPLYETPWAALTNAANCAIAAGDLDKGEGYLRAALRRNPAFTAALGRMAELQLQRDNPQLARAFLQRYSAEAPHTAKTLQLGIAIEQRLGNLVQARKYEQYLRRNFPEAAAQ